MGNGFVIEEKARKGMKIVICFILFLYPILLFEADVGGVPIQTWMLYISIARWRYVMLWAAKSQGKIGGHLLTDAVL